MALGFHPLYASENKNELRLFSQCLDKTSYIGEIGLDFSNEGLKTKDDQVFVLEKVLQLLSKKNKIVSVHSRRAEKVLLFEILFRIWHHVKMTMGVYNHIPALICISFVAFFLSQLITCLYECKANDVYSSNSCFSIIPLKNSSWH